MYTAYFGLKDVPFAITPDPHYLYMGSRYQEALAHLLYGTGEAGGFVQLTGEVGTGKTTLIRALVEQRAEHVDIALCLNPKLTVIELLAAICDELQIPYEPSNSTLKSLTDVLTTHLLQTHAQGRRTVFIIDEAQNLSRDVLEQIRLLTNLETHRHKLLRIILVGQPELQRLLARQDMRQLAQRITARYHLAPLDRGEIRAYIVHRLQVAGAREDLFTKGALQAVYRLTRGVPRLINIVCDRALLGAYSLDRRRVNRSVVRRAAREALIGSSPRRFFNLGFALATVAVMGLGLWAVNRHIAPFMPASMVAATSPTAVSAGMATTTSASVPPPAPAIRIPRMAAAPQTAPEPAAAALHSPESIHKLPVESLLGVDASSQAEALASLLRLWGKEPLLESNLSSCDQVQQYGLRCLTLQGDWSDLRRYNHPAILSLQKDDRIIPVVLGALEGDRAILQVDGDAVQVDLHQLDSLWNGDFLLLWRLQTSLSVIGPGVVGEPVLWLRKRLALAEGLSPAGKTSVFSSRTFDPALQARVQRFQRVNQLQPDGIVGQRTMPLLNNLAPAPGTPFLTPPLLGQVD